MHHIAARATVTAGGVAPITGEGDAENVIGYAVVLHFSRPVALPLGTPIARTLPEDYDGPPVPPVPLQRHLPPSNSWLAESSLKGTVFLIGPAGP